MNHKTNSVELNLSKFLTSKITHILLTYRYTYGTSINAYNLRSDSRCKYCKKKWKIHFYGSLPKVYTTRGRLVPQSGSWMRVEWGKKIQVITTKPCFTCWLSFTDSQLSITVINPVMLTALWVCLHLQS